MARSFKFQSRPDSRIFLASFGEQGHEDSSTRLVIDVSDFELLSESETGDLRVLQLHLTVQQMAELVKMFFKEMISPANIYTNMLQRLLRHRWAVMTHPVHKETWPGRSGPSMPRYDDLGVPSNSDRADGTASVFRNGRRSGPYPYRAGEPVEYTRPDRTKG